MAGHQLVGMHPARQGLDALEPRSDGGIVAPAYAELVGKVQVSARRNVDDGRRAADDEFLALQAQFQDGERAVHAPAKKLGHGRLAGLLELKEEAQRADVAGELVIVPEQPAQELASFRLTFPAEFAESRREVVEDDAGLGNARGAEFEHRRLAHLVYVLAVLGRSRLAVEEVDVTRLPFRTAEVQHQRGLKAVAGLGEAVKRVLSGCHGARKRRSCRRGNPDPPRRWPAGRGRSRAANSRARAAVRAFSTLSCAAQVPAAAL